MAAENLIGQTNTADYCPLCFAETNSSKDINVVSVISAALGKMETITHFDCDLQLVQNTSLI